jgi:raffinose/stachyose/melibiose transport system permease protein
VQHTKRRRSLIYAMFIIPAIAFFAAFFIFPFFKSLWLSFTDAYGYNPEIHFIGLKNYQEALANPNFKNALWVTLKYTVFVTILANLVALGLAFLLDGNVHFKKVFRAVFFLPNLMSLIIVGFVWVFLYGGVYRSFVELLHIPEALQISWLGNEHMALISMGITAVWQCAGYYMLIYIAGLQSIPHELIEAAQIDGASPWSVIKKIKFPMLAPVIFMNTILLVTSCFKTFDIPMAMTSGGPAGATTTIALQIYNTGFRANRTGYATAQSVILFLIICTITAVLYIFQNRKGAVDE